MITSLATIITLLQLALSLLSNPNVANNEVLKAQANAFASQAIVLAGQALAQPESTPLGTPIAITPQIPVSNPVIPTIISDTSGSGTGGPSSPVENTPSTPAAQSVPSCTLTAVRNVNADYSTVVSWTSEGLSTSTVGNIYASIGQSAGTVIYSSGIPVKLSSGKKESVVYGSFYKAVFGTGLATCYATLQENTTSTN